MDTVGIRYVCDPKNEEPNGKSNGNPRIECRDMIPLVGNQLEKKMEHEFLLPESDGKENDMETRVIQNAIRYRS